MKLTIAYIAARAPRDTYNTLVELYLKRIAAYTPCGAAVFRSEEAFFQFFENQRARTAPLLVLLDPRGKNMSSEAFAAWLGQQRDSGRQSIVFAIGPADGWSETARKQAGLLLSLGPMTLPHELARVVLAEQLYRAFTILAGHPYHSGH